MADVEAAVKALGWKGQLAGPVEFGGVRFWAVAETDPEVRLVGCLVEGAEGWRAASLLAAYTPRAVLVDDGDVTAGLLVDAAILDVGVVADRGGVVRVYATAGARVAEPSGSVRERQLLDAVTAAMKIREGT